MRRLLNFLPIIFLLSSCSSGNSNDDRVKAPDNQDAIQASIFVDHLTTHVVLVTKYTVYSGSTPMKIVHTDTIPSLGTTQEQVPDTLSDDDDATKTITIPKDYNIFVTVH